MLLKLLSTTITLFFLIATSFNCSTKKHEVSDTKDLSISEQLPDPLEAGWQGEKVCEVVEENEKIRVLKCSFPPKVGHEKHYHDPHVGYTLAGGKFRITDESGTREVNVPTGYSFSNDSITVHEVQNIGESTAEFLIIEYKK